MTFDVTWTITAIIAVSSFLSPIAVAIINNMHNTKMRKIELEHDEYIRWLNFQQSTIINQFNVYYSDKKNAFADFQMLLDNFHSPKKKSVNIKCFNHLLILPCCIVISLTMIYFLTFLNTSIIFSVAVILKPNVMTILKLLHL